MFAKDYNPVVQEYIRQNLARPVSSGTSLDNPDDALDMVKSRTESIIEYADRLQQIISQPLNSD